VLKNTVFVKGTASAVPQKAASAGRFRSAEGPSEAAGAATRISPSPIPPETPASSFLTPVP